jgi:hypothetical protein
MSEFSSLPFLYGLPLGYLGVFCDDLDISSDDCGFLLSNKALLDLLLHIDSSSLVIGGGHMLTLELLLVVVTLDGPENLSLELEGVR